MYLFFGSLFAYISTFTIASLTIITYLWYFTYDDSKKLPLLFQVLVLGIYSTAEHEVHQYIHENPVPTKETDWRVNTLTVLTLLFCIFNFFIMKYMWIFYIPGMYFILKTHYNEAKQIIKTFRVHDPEYEI